jgi:ribosomal protein S18 acetylase RimI-like enzyme
MEIMAIGILSRYQGRGIGKRLLDYAMRKLLSIGPTRVVVHTGARNYKAQKLFLSRGFVPEGVREGFYRAEDAIFMTKTIQSKGE